MNQAETIHFQQAWTDKRAD